MLNKLSRFKILFAIFILVIIDQVLKNAVLAFLVIPQRIIGILSLEIYKNYGIAFGLPVSINLFYFAIFIFLICFLIGWRKKVWGNWSGIGKEKIFAASLIAAGALGNIIDRIKLGYIIDYINIGGILVFNLADVFIFFGVLCYLKEFLKKQY